jgi:uncharacterized protein
MEGRISSETNSTSYTPVRAEIVTASLMIYGNDAYPITYRHIFPSSAPRAQYAGFKNEKTTLRAGTIHRHGAKPLSCDIIFERDVAVTLRDDINMYTDVFRPAGTETAPCIFAWSPYGKQIGGA